MSQSLTKVVIDTREQRPWHFDQARFIVTRRKLEFFDYAIEGYPEFFGIERKSFGDFIGSVTPGVRRDRLWAELERAKSAGARGMVIVGNHDDESLTGAQGLLIDVYAHHYLSRVSPEFIVGSAIAIERDFGYPVYFDGYAAQNRAAHTLAKWSEYLQSKYVSFPKPKTGVNQ